MTNQLQTTGARQGGISLPALIALPIVLMALVTALSSCQFVEINSELQTEGDASALAGIQILAGDASAVVAKDAYGGTKRYSQALGSRRGEI